MLKDKKQARPKQEQQIWLRKQATPKEVFQKSDKRKSDRCFGPLHKRIHCPARNSQYNLCGNTGYWKKACRSKQLSEASGQIFPIYSADKSDDIFLGEVCIDTVQSSTHDMPWQAEVCLNCYKLQFKLDSGTDVSVIPHSLFEKLAKKEILNWSLQINCC